MDGTRDEPRPADAWRESIDHRCRNCKDCSSVEVDLGHGRAKGLTGCDRDREDWLIEAELRPEIRPLAIGSLLQ